MRQSQAAQDELVWDLIKKASEDAVHAISRTMELVEDHHARGAILLGSVAALLQLGACVTLDVQPPEVRASDLVAFALGAARYAAEASKLVDAGKPILPSDALIKQIVAAWKEPAKAPKKKTR